MRVAFAHVRWNGAPTPNDSLTVASSPVAAREHRAAITGSPAADGRCDHVIHRRSQPERPRRRAMRRRPDHQAGILCARGAAATGGTGHLSLRQNGSAAGKPKRCPRNRWAQPQSPLSAIATGRLVEHGDQAGARAPVVLSPSSASNTLWGNAGHRPPNAHPAGRAAGWLREIPNSVLSYL